MFIDSINIAEQIKLFYTLDHHIHTMMSLPSLPSLVATCSLVFGSIICISFAVTKPLISIQGIYDLHLFPENDVIDYTVSEFHRISQFSHIAALSFFMMSMLVMMTLIILSNNVSESVKLDIIIVTIICITIACLAHITGLATLIKIGLDYKHLGDSLPLPSPNATIKAGAFMDLIGLLTSIAALVVIYVATISHNEITSYLPIRSNE
jgi:hypothetical protein